MSSPMIMMMLGFCWAAAGPHDQSERNCSPTSHLLSPPFSDQVKSLWANTPSLAGWSPPTLLRGPMPRFSCSMLLLLPLQDHVRGIHTVDLALHLVPRDREIAGEPCRIDQVHVVATQHDIDRA